MVRYLLIFFLISCSSATKYQKMKKGEGYVDSQKGDLHYTEFHANSYTKVNDTMVMAQYRANKVCAPQQSYFLGSEDHSRIRNVTKTSGTYPYSNVGYYPYRRGWSLGLGFGSYSSESWQDQEVYPKLKIIYLCGEKFFAPSGKFQKVTAKELSYIYKDLLGAIMVEDPETNSLLKKGDIILRMQGQRVDELAEFYYRFHHQQQQQLELLRDGVRMTVSVQAQDISDQVQRYNQELISKMCDLDKDQCPKKD